MNQHQLVIRGERLVLLLFVFASICLVQQERAAASPAKRADINTIYVKNVLKNMNTAIEPCEDFYNYACGNWQHNYANTKYYVDMPGYMEYELNKQLLATLRAQRNSTELHRKIWQYYKSCATLKEPALNTYLKLVQAELNMEWPIMRAAWHERWQNMTNFDWLRAIATLRKYGLNGVFITQHINVRPTNSNHYLLQILQHVPQQKLQLHQQDVNNIFINFGLSAAESAILTASIIFLEQQLINLTTTGAIRENVTNVSGEEGLSFENSYEELSIQELLHKLPGIDWQQYFEIILKRSLDISLVQVQTFNLQPSYFDSLLQLLHGTDNQTLCYYIMLKFMYTLAPDLPLAEDKPMTCIRHLRGYMPLAMNYLYEAHVFHTHRATVADIMQRMFNDLRRGFAELLAQNQLQLNATEQLFLSAELQSMELKIGNIPPLAEIEFIAHYYARFVVNDTNFYANHLRAIELLTSQQLLKLENRPPSAAEHFYLHEAETASSSSPIKIFDNVVLLPYGYLQMPFFHVELHALFQYSLLGFMLAHEIIHAFDLFHIVYDMHSNYNPMGEHIAQHFNEFVMCLAQEPNDILSENMADIAGIRLAFKTYFDEVADSANDTVLLGVLQNYSAEQMFFINSVQFLCANMLSIDKMEAKVLNLEHEMHNKRVHENWAHFEGFSKAFGCTNESTMNPKTKCRLW